jgi:hypothetical protein
MSMKVFYAYLFKENAEFADVDRARAYLADLRKKFIEWVPTDMLRWDSFYRDMKTEFDVIEALEKDTKQSYKGGVWDYQLQAVIFAKTIDGVNYVAIQFFPSNSTAKFLKENVKLRPFWYENQTDEGFDLPDWEEREKFWEAVYEKCRPASEVGLSCDIYDGNNFMVTDTIAREFWRLKEEKSKEKSEEKAE